MVFCHYLKKKLIIFLPIFRSTPPLVLGIPVFRAMLFFTPARPINLLNENDNPNFPLNPNMIILLLKHSG